MVLDTEVLKIIESDPLNAGPVENIREIFIYVDEHNLKAKARPSEVAQVVQNIPNPEGVISIRAGFEGKLTKLPCLDRFTNITQIWIGGKIKSYEQLHHLSGLEHVFFINFKHRDLSEFGNLDLEHLQLIRGYIEHIDIKADRALLQSCNKLTTLEGFTCRILYLESCHSVDLATLGDVRSLWKLDLLGCKNVTNLDFAPRCKELEHLAITATKLQGFDFSALRETRSLKTLFLDTRKPSILQAASTFNPDVIVSDGDTAFRKGEEEPLELFREALPD